MRYLIIFNRIENFPFTFLCTEGNTSNFRILKNIQSIWRKFITRLYCSYYIVKKLLQNFFELIHFFMNTFQTKLIKFPNNYISFFLWYEGRINNHHQSNSLFNDVDLIAKQECIFLKNYPRKKQSQILYWNSLHFEPAGKNFFHMS